MKAASVEQMKEIDRISINEFGIAGIVLMENAGSAVAEQALMLGGEKYTVVCGKGNNGGDGSVVARHLHNKGKDVNLMLIGNAGELKGDALVNYNILQKLGVRIENKLDKEILEGSDVIVDALLGIGVEGAPRGDIKDAVTAVNNAGKTVVSVDVPSGLNADTGAVEGACVKADVTVTFGVNKIGLVCYPGAEYAGRVVVSDISFAPGAIERQNINVNITEKVVIPKRAQNSHKGSFGSVFALCGSTGFTGAAFLASVSALKTGCGLVTLGIPYSLYNIMAQKHTEVMTLPLADNEGKLSADCIPVLDNAVKNCDAIVCGCGLGRSDDITEIITHILKTSKIPVVLDADGINALAGHKDILKEKTCDVVITPHLGEMSRIICQSVEYIQNNAVEVAKTFSVEYNVVTVLKGANTIVALPDGDVHINTNGNSGMATAGSGDVLAGIICSLIAQGQPPYDAAVSGVFLHGSAGDLASQEFGKHGMLASDILNNIPYAIRKEDSYHGGKPIQNVV